MIFDEMRADWDNAKHTGDQFWCVIFWSLAWCAWIGMAIFFPFMLWRMC
jgi:hypothetical protein